MIEKVFSFASGDSKLIERIIEDEHAAINHMILTQFDALPEHNANSNVYLVVVRGCMAIRLDEQVTREYDAGSILVIPCKTKMNVSNQSAPPLEFFVFKAPGPGHIAG